MLEETIDAGDAGETITLAFSFSAIEALRDPDAAVEDARRWSENVGVISDAPAPEVINRIRDLGIYGEDFFPDMNREGTLTGVKRGTDTDRYVYVGTSDKDAEIASKAGWEFQLVDEAAKAAGWE
jgi:hypothetical protein